MMTSVNRWGTWTSTGAGVMARVLVVDDNRKLKDAVLYKPLGFPRLFRLIHSAAPVRLAAP